MKLSVVALPDCENIRVACEEKMSEEHGVAVSVDRDLCIGNGVCVALAPASFRLDEMMKAVVLDPAGESEESLLAAASACPTQAIYLSVDGDPLYP